jgi:hypothetical protein
MPAQEVILAIASDVTPPPTQPQTVDRGLVAAPTISGIIEDEALVMVISHSCEFTKTESNLNYPVLVAPIASMGEMDSGLRGQVRKDGVTRYWPLPVDEFVPDESAVDLTLVQPVLRQDLLAGTRICSIPPDGRLALADRLTSMISLRERRDDL